MSVHPLLTACLLLAGLSGLSRADDDKQKDAQALREENLKLRESLLRTAGIELPDEIDVGTVAPDDLVDAAAAAWTAHRYSGHAAHRLPGGDVEGSVAVIWY